MGYFSNNLADAEGIGKSVVLTCVYFYCNKNRENKRNYKKGHYWTWLTSRSLSDSIGGLTKTSAHRYLIEAERDGYIVSGSFNVKSYDRTKWYRPTKKLINIMLSDFDYNEEKLIAKSELIIENYLDEKLSEIQEEKEQLEFDKKVMNDRISEMQKKECSFQNGTSLKPLVLGRFTSLKSTLGGVSQNGTTIPYIYYFNIYSYNSLTYLLNCINACAREKKNKEVGQEEKNSIFDINGRLKKLEYSEKLSKSEKIKYVKRDESKKFFDKCRKLYPGRSKGLEIEFSNFLKKYNRSEWSSFNPIMDLIEIKKAIVSQMNERDLIKKHRPDYFLPQWKHFSTWINSRCWEESSDPIMEEIMEEVEAENKKQAEKKRLLEEEERNLEYVRNVLANKK